jgi:hypothetical protein
VSAYVNGLLTFFSNNSKNIDGTAEVNFNYTTDSSQAGKNITLQIKVNDSAGLISQNTTLGKVYVKDITPPKVNLISPINNVSINQMLIFAL